MYARVGCLLPVVGPAKLSVDGAEGPEAQKRVIGHETQRDAQDVSDPDPYAVRCPEFE
jgi:hypothetical protein